MAFMLAASPPDLPNVSSVICVQCHLHIYCFVTLLIQLTGLIIAASVLLAAGVAVYEKPQVREWVEMSRRKIALALHSLGDEINPPSQCGQDDEDAAIQAARARRDEIMAANREKFLRRHSANADSESKNVAATSSSTDVTFDDFLDKHESGTYTLPTRDNDSNAEPGELRRRTEGVRGLERGSLAADPFGDEHAQVVFDQNTASLDRDGGRGSRESTATLPAEDSPLQVPSQASRFHPLVDGSPPSQSVLVDLTTLTSGPTASSHEERPSSEQFQQADSAPQGQNEETWSNMESSVPSLAGSAEEIHYASGTDDNGRYLDVISESEGMSTPGSWTEVGSEISEEDAAMR